MRIRLTGALLALGVILLLSVTAAADRAEEKKRQKAWEEAQKQFTRAFKSEDAAVRREAVLKLMPFTDLGAAKLVVEKVYGQELHIRVLDAAMGVVAGTTDPAVITWLITKAGGRGSWQLRAPLVEALGYIDSPRVDKLLIRLVEKEKDPRVLSMAIFGLSEKKLTAGLDQVIPHLEHEDWQVRVAAIEAISTIKDEKGIVPLIDALMNERGRLRQDVSLALKRMTGKDFGLDANAWRKWFYERDGDGDEAAPPPPDPAGVASGVKEPTYFGIKVISDRVMFIIDLSHSMKTAIDVDKMALAREAARTGPDSSGDRPDEKFEETIQWWKIKDRLDLAKAQLKFVIKNLGPKQSFEIVAFSDKVAAWNGGKVLKASARAKAKAVQFVDQLDTDGETFAGTGATAAGAVLDFAFEMAGPGAADKNYKSSVDTIFFLSDGAPSDRNEDEILEEIAARNRLRKIKIHVVAILNYSTRFLRLLAKQNGGTYKFFKVENMR